MSLLGTVMILAGAGWLTGVIANYFLGVPPKTKTRAIAHNRQNDK